MHSIMLPTSGTLAPAKSSVSGRSGAALAVKLLGHSDVSTTMSYTHVLEVAGGAVRSPLDALLPA